MRSARASASGPLGSASARFVYFVYVCVCVLVRICVIGEEGGVCRSLGCHLSWP